MLKFRFLNLIFSLFIIILLSTPIANAAVTTTATPAQPVTTATPAQSVTTTATPSSTPAATQLSAPSTTPNDAPTPAGQVIITSGTFTAMNLNKQIRTLIRGANFYDGDTLITGHASKAQVRYTDGTVLSLDPDSQLKVTDYHYQQAGLKDKNFASLLKGGFRALTGLISKQDPTAYQVDTGVAAIAVRGTSFGAALNSSGQLFIGVWKGKISIQNAAGTIILGEGENYDYATVTSAESSPVGLLSEPDELAGRCIQIPGA